MKFLLIFLLSLGLFAQEQEVNLSVEPLYSTVSFDENGCMNNVLIAFRNNTNKRLKEVSFLFMIFDTDENAIYKDNLTLKLNMEVGKPSITLFKMKKDSCVNDPYLIRSARVISYK